MGRHCFFRQKKIRLFRFLSLNKKEKKELITYIAILLMLATYYFLHLWI